MLEPNRRADGVEREEGGALFSAALPPLPVPWWARLPTCVLPLSRRPLNLPAGWPPLLAPLQGIFTSALLSAPLLFIMLLILVGCCAACRRQPVLGVGCLPTAVCTAP